MSVYRLVEVVGVLEVGSPQAMLEPDRSVGTNQHRNCASTTGGSGGTLFVDCDIRRYNDSVSAIPAAALHPVEGVEKRVCSSITGIGCVHT